MIQNLGISRVGPSHGLSIDPGWGSQSRPLPRSCRTGLLWENRAAEPTPNPPGEIHAVSHDDGRTDRRPGDRDGSRVVALSSDRLARRLGRLPPGLLGAPVPD